MKIAIVGVGGVGGLMGALLIDAGEDVVLIARGESLRALREHGLTLESGMGALNVRPRLATDAPAAAGVMDLVIVATKAWQLQEAAVAIQPMLGESTVVLPVQNGVEAADVLSGMLGNERVLAGIVSVVSYLDGPGHVVHRGDSIIVRVAEQDSRRSPRVEQIAQTFTRARMDCDIPSDIHLALWQKLVALSAWSVVGSLTRVPMGVWRQAPGTVALFRGLMEESVAVAATEGVTLPAGYIQEHVDELTAFHPKFTTSMHRDVLEGKPSEVETQVGVIVRKGQAAAVAAPLYTMAYHSLLPQENQARVKQ